MTTPISARRLRVSIAIAGVGSGPTSTTSMPMVMKPGGQRRFEHVAGEPRVLADHDEMLVRAVVKAFADRHRDLERRFRRHRLDIGGAADAVGAEKLARHRATDTPQSQPGCNTGCK